MKKTIKLTVFSLGLLLIGCKDEFLETFPTSQISAETIAEASAKAAEGRTVLSDYFVSEEYRRAMAQVYAKRALTQLS